MVMLEEILLMVIMEAQEAVVRQVLVEITVVQVT